MSTEKIGGHLVGTVLKINRDTREVAVFIPRLMSTLYSGNAESHKYPTNNGIELSDVTTNIASTVNKVNYIWVKPLDYDEPMPEVGSKVLLKFLERSVHLGFWEKFNMNNDYSVIEEERYPLVHKLQINDKSIDVNKEDNIRIILPDTYNISEGNNDTKSFTISENFNFYKKEDLNTAITNLQKSIKYISDTYVNTFKTTLMNLKLFASTPTGELLTHLNDTYETIKNKGVTTVVFADNLIDCNDEYLYFNTGLTELKNTYNLYNTYRTNYSNTTAEQKTKMSELTTDVIDNNITIAFDSLLSSTNKDNIDDYITYIKGLFPSTVSIIYEYTKDGNNMKYSINDTNTLFSDIDETATYVTNATDLGNVLNLAVNAIVPTNTSGLDIKYASYKVLGWRDSDNKNIFGNTTPYFMYKDIYAHPMISGLAISYDDNTYTSKINIQNDYKKTYTLKDSKNNTTETAINTYLNSSDFKHGYWIQLLENGTEIVKLTITYTDDEMYSMMNRFWESIDIEITTKAEAQKYETTLEMINTIKTKITNYDSSKFTYHNAFTTAYALLHS